MSDQKPKKLSALELRQRAQEEILSAALASFLEDVEGHWPNDEEIIRESHHIQMAPGSPLGEYCKDGQVFTRFFCWRRKHVIALKFDDGAPLHLLVVRVPDDELPYAVRILTKQGPRP